MSDTPVSLGPVAARERLLVVDVLRGFALLGILLVNMPFFARGVADTLLPPDLAATPWFDMAGLWLMRFAAESKFYVLFSFLFGLGFGIQLLRAQDAAKPGFLRWYVRRLLVLLGIGLVHALLIWSGDILTWYATLGGVLLLARNAPPRRLVRWGVVLALVPIVLTLVTTLAAQASAFPDMAAELAAESAAAAAVYTDGTRAQVLAQNITDYLGALVLLPLRAPTVLAMFLFGLACAKTRLLHDLDAHAATFRRMMRWGLPVAIVLNAIDATISLWVSRLTFTWVGFVGTASQTIGALGALAFFIGGFALLMRQPAWQARLAPIAATGQMALSNYLAQSLVATTLFYGVGLGQYGRVGFGALGLLTIVIYGVQVLVSVAWMRAFRYGPMEWLWRTLTYGAMQPLVRRPSPVPTLPNTMRQGDAAP